MEHLNHSAVEISVPLFTELSQYSHMGFSSWASLSPIGWPKRKSANPISLLSEQLHCD